jgi:16S rRNA processing protein RimM
MVVPRGVKAGRISKPNGLQGEVNIIFEPQAGKHIEPDNPLFIDIDGQRVPFFVEEVELVSEEKAIIKFEFVDSLEAARKLSGCTIYLDPRYQTDDLNEIGDLANLVGYTASDRELGPLGNISDYLPHSKNPLFVIQAGDKELMIPAVRDLIEHIDSGQQTVQFILPEGITLL